MKAYRWTIEEWLQGNIDCYPDHTRLQGYGNITATTTDDELNCMYEKILDDFQAEQAHTSDNRWDLADSTELFRWRRWLIEGDCDN